MRLNDQRLGAATSESLSNSDAFDLVVNATIVSLQAERPDFPEAIIGAETLAYDLVYAECATPFMQWAGALGARGADGLGMLTEQAAASFFLWHKILPDTRTLISLFKRDHTA